jgi:hypothetical protein
VRDWNQDSSLDKMLNNGYRRREKIIEEDINSDAIFLYKPGAELPNLLNFTNQTVRI